VTAAPRFYFFDVGVVNFLARRGRIVQGSERFGKAFEHFLFMELCAHSRYSGLGYPLAYWRTASPLEVDFILGDSKVAVEVKGT
jgi:predicted AAA+ superfamily ATPase